MQAQVGINEYIALVNRYLDKNMTDGLPVIPPSASAVEAMCTASDLPPDHVVGGYPIRQAPFSDRKNLVSLKSTSS